MAGTEKLYRFCIYTMRHTDELAKAYNQGGKGAFVERRKWATGSTLFHAAQHDHARMPILFGAADVSSGLLYWAKLEDVRIDESHPESPTTTYEFSNLTRLKKPLPLSSLVLKDTGKPLSDNYIRPYAICITPTFLLPESEQ